MNKRLLHISTARSWRGGEQQIAYLCEELSKLGWEQHIACIADAPLAEWAKKKGFPVLALKKGSSLDLRFSAKLKAYSKNQNIQLWHAHDAHAHGFAVYAKHLFRAVPKLIVSRRVDFPVAKSWMSAFKYNHPGVFRYLCVSQAIADILRSSLKPQASIHTVHSAIDANRFKNTAAGKLKAEFPEQAAKKWIGNVAALTGHKDLFTFLDTAARFKNEDSKMHFFIVGKGELETELKRYAKELGIENMVSFLGFRPDIPEIQADLDVFLFSSEMEGLGTSVLDAFAARTPVVATKAGGIPEMVIHEKTGLLYEVKDNKGLAAGILRILSDPKLAEKLVEGASEKLKAFSPPEMARKTAEHYQAALVS